MGLKISQAKLLKSQLSVYSDEEGVIQIFDLLVFLVIPLIVSALVAVFEIRLKAHFNFDVIYGFVAFLSGFVFSAYVIFLSFKAALDDKTASRMKSSAEKTIKEIAITSLSVFLCGLIIVVLAATDSIIKTQNTTYICSRTIVHTISSFLFLFVFLNLLMIIKKLHSLIELD